MKLIKISLFFIVMIFTNCTFQKCDCVKTPELVIHNDSIISSIENSIDRPFIDYWKSYDLNLLRDQKTDSYRWAYKNYLSHYMKIYILTKNENSPSLRIIERITPTTTNFEIDSLLSDRTLKLSNSDWKEFERVIDETCFWNLKTDLEEQYLDGEPITIEGFKPHKNHCTEREYHLVFRMRGDDQKIMPINSSINKLEKLGYKEFR